MLKSVVPTPVKVVPGASEVASIAKTSSSGSVNWTAGLQSRPSGSLHALLAGSNWTIRPVSGAGAPEWSVLGPGRPPGTVTPSTVQGPAAVKPLHTAGSGMTVVWFPDLKTAA